ncbi:hypothetical protein RUL31_03900 [Bacillus atrophaeus]|uniref:hypothetical protein n=1 Tax=Bacillus atrophaeus TaxID=1452 RepID=UPI0028F6FC18|nr:hypothetical protein [Bacillus atrophaeus]WNV80464.1 hypothetical protein RUL31_03900 [Bacillus atrophaeus]
MDKLIADAINKFYNKESAQEEYLSLCKQEITLSESLESYLKKEKINYENTNEDEIWPSATFRFEFEAFEKDDFNISYSSKLMISKLAPIFYIQHEFELENIDPKRTTPILDGFSTQTYSMPQQEFDTKVNQILKDLGYNALDYQEMNEVICDLDIKTEPLFGPQVTVELALFHDLLELCPE